MIGPTAMRLNPVGYAGALCPVEQYVQHLLL